MPGRLIIGRAVADQYLVTRRNRHGCYNQFIRCGGQWLRRRIAGFRLAVFDIMLFIIHKDAGGIRPLNRSGSERNFTIRRCCDAAGLAGLVYFPGKSNVLRVAILHAPDALAGGVW